ncbi:uncharacterized protein LOC121107608 [Gallus gallus]|uniref:uncharacterized protein LOC121107608 n=1 Tax=Gallus gallus TaxID=9031 RepID=UPI001AE57006|nr:uncharacterized protein LOC121107608 [Gallus gallus]
MEEGAQLGDTSSSSKHFVRTGGGGESLLPGKLRLCALSSAGDKAEWLSRPSPAHCSIFGRFQREGEPKRDRDQQPDRVAERGELGGDSPRASPTPPPPSIALRSFLRDANPLLRCAPGGGGDTRILRPQMPRSPRSVAAGGSPRRERWAGPGAARSGAGAAGPGAILVSAEAAGEGGTRRCSASGHGRTGPRPRPRVWAPGGTEAATLWPRGGKFCLRPTRREGLVATQSTEH